MSATAYVGKGVPEMVPQGLQSKHFGSSAILSRTRRNILPSGNSQSVGPGQQITFNVVSNTEYLDAKTASLHFKLKVPLTGAGTNKVSAPKANWASMFRQALLEVHGQSLIDANTELDVKASLDRRLYENPSEDIASTQITEGAWSTVAGNYLYDVARKVGNDMVYHVCIPLSKIVDFYGLERSYLPLFAMNQTLRLTTNSVARALLNNEAAPSTYTMDEVRIEADFLMMSDEVNEAFRELVRESAVSFHYPTHFTMVEGLAAGSKGVNVKTNLNMSCLNSIVVHMSYNDPAVTTYTPTQSAVPIKATTMDVGQFNVYIDSRPVFSEPINNAASLYDELKKVVLNEQDRAKSETPGISAKGWLQGLGTSVYNSSHSFRDINGLLYPANLMRELKKGSVSGVATNLTGGNIAIQINSLPIGAVADLNVYVFFQSTREVRLSENMVQVIR